MWQDAGYVEPLAEFRLLLFDHRGRGGSGRPTAEGDHRYDEYVADARMLADVAGLDRYAFIGYSFGGAVGLRVAARDPRLCALVALGTVYDLPDAAAPATDYATPAGIGMDALVEMIEQEEGIVLPAPLRAQFTDTNPKQFRLTLAANAGAGDPWDELPAITPPVLLIAGADEDPDLVQDAMAARLPDARSVHLAGCGHVGAFLRADEVSAAAAPLLRCAAA